jgi:hypothetical protein
MPRPKQLTLKQMERAVEQFNAAYPVGKVIAYRSHPSAVPRLTSVRAAAFILGGHTPCAFVEGVAGCVALTALGPNVGESAPLSESVAIRAAGMCRQYEHGLGNANRTAESNAFAEFADALEADPGVENASDVLNRIWRHLRNGNDDVWAQFEPLVTELAIPDLPFAHSRETRDA